MRGIWTFLSLLPIAVTTSANETTTFCLEGQFDLGARYQGMHPAGGERYPTKWCVTTDDETFRVHFHGVGRSNPDMDGEFQVTYLPPELVRIVVGNGRPDIEFQGTDNPEEARSVRRLDPRRLVEEWRSDPRALSGVDINVSGKPGREQLQSVRTTVDLPLRGTVDATWDWNWTDADQPIATLTVDGEVFFVARGQWQNLPEDAALPWDTSSEDVATQVPGENWPARISMQLKEIADDVYLVENVRSGFRHMVVDTSDGLVVADAPAGWVEFHQIPPSDLVPGLGISGLSERFVDFLQKTLPERPILGVALTHAHDDHAGGARAFSAAGGSIYATRDSALFIATALNRQDMPGDRLATIDRPAAVSPVDDVVELGDAMNRVRIVSMGANPHVDSMLGVWAVEAGYFFVSDIHVPHSDADSPADHRAATECWFAHWATDNLPSDVTIVNSHSSPMTPVSRLQHYLDSDACRRPQ